MNDMMNPRRHRDRNSQGSKGEESENLFFEGGGSSSDEEPDRPRRDQREDNRHWESRMRVFEFKEVPENKRVSLITTKLRGKVSAWWQPLKLTRERVRKPRVTSWRKMKKLLRDNFIPHNYQLLMYQRLQNLKQRTKSVEDYTTEFYQLIARNDIQETEDLLVSRYIGGLRVQIMDYVNMFDPSKCKKAEKRHLFADEEWEDKGVTDDEYEEPLVLLAMIGPGSCDNLIAKEAVQKLGWKTVNHPKPYKLQWLKKGGEVTISKRVLVAFSVGTTYKDSVWCDVVPMDACHLLLGRPWEYD
ncbi:putative reverse transcriptase domain-containing protein, partial [Tanacetum coccineum]